VKFYTAEILLALEYMHQQHIIYRDLKPENVVIDVNGHIKVIDFGFAKKLQSSSNPKHHYKTYTNCGTLGYTAPEVLLSHGASFEADIWSFGIILCELFSGTLPFEEKEDPQAINEQILKCELKFPRDSD
jgi:protein kinase A